MIHFGYFHDDQRRSWTIYEGKKRVSGRTRAGLETEYTLAPSSPFSDDPHVIHFWSRYVKLEHVTQEAQYVLNEYFEFEERRESIVALQACRYRILNDRRNNAP